MAVRKLGSVPETEQSATEKTAVYPALTFRVYPLANAVTVVALAAYVLCAIISAISIDLLIAFFQPWLHGLTLQPLRPADPAFRLDAFVSGLITLGVSTWVATAAIAGLYNIWSRR